MYTNYETSDELQHYGVKGMKWGVRRDARALANRRRNVSVRDAKDDYRTGRISKKERDARIKSANASKKSYMSSTKSALKKMKTKEDVQELASKTSDVAKKEVSNLGIKKGLHTANRFFGTMEVGGSAFTAAAAVGLAAVNPALTAAAAITVGSSAMSSAVSLGGHYLAGKIIDKLT